MFLANAALRRGGVAAVRQGRRCWLPLTTNGAAALMSSSSSTSWSDQIKNTLDHVSNGPSPRSFSSHYSSFAEPEPTLFRGTFVGGKATDNATTGGASALVDPDSSTVVIAHDHDALLRNDIRVMGSLLGQVILRQGSAGTLDRVEQMRGLAKEFRAASTTEQREAALQALADFALQLTDAELGHVSQAFTHFMALANAAEQHHRIRRLREIRAARSSTKTVGGALYPKPDSCGGVIPNLLEKGKTPHEIWEALSTQTTELVLTAHPTEVNRRTILAKHRRIQEILTQADALRSAGTNPSSFEQMQLDQALWREISSLWQSDEVSRIKPTPEDEAERGTLVVETVLWDAVPLFLRKLDVTAREYLGEDKGLPLTAQPIKFASWMGGDRDGNPNVQPDTTRRVCLRNRAKAAALLAEDLIDLERQLSIIACSDEFRSRLPQDAGLEPYRAFLKPIIAKLRRTRLWAEQELLRHQTDKKTHPHHRHWADGVITANQVYLRKEELMEELLLIHRSLCETGNATEADGILTDVIRKVSAFGLTLIPLDVRQEKDRHTEAMDAITRYLGLGSYAQWDEHSRTIWLTSQISSRRPLIRPGVWHEHPEVFSPTAVDTLETFQMIAEQYDDSLGAYVISQCTSASDVLAVLLLQLDAGVKKPLRVVPLFETLSDLNGATKQMQSLFSLPVYMGIINGKQEVMIGYSDSAKDAGRLSASFAQFETQEALAKLARDYSVDLTFFHGKGGTVGRGGNPQTFHAIMSHAPKTINGKFRVTEQGEMIHQNFGHGDRAERTLDIYTAAILAERLTERKAPEDKWRDLMKELSTVSCAAYRKVVREDPRFVPYFRMATPETEFADLKIGSRPAKRKPSGGVESLRAIPWNFAWTQTRFNLPSWLGVGQAISQTLQSNDKAPVLREMYEQWGPFRTTIDLVEMVLSKSESSFAKLYEDMLVDDEKAKELGTEVRALHLQTEQAILNLTGHTILAENNKILRRALTVRNPYVDCLNVLQAETLKRIRKTKDEEQEKVLKDALLTTITGIANGVGNTG